MKEIALLALQKLPSPDEDNVEDVHSDLLLDGGVGHAKFRDSMYSVLDDEDLNFQDEAESNVSIIREEDISPAVENLELEDKDATGLPKLHRTVWDHNLQEVKSFLGQGTNLRSRANDGKAALHYASLNLAQGLDMMRLLLDSKNEDIINLGDTNGQTPLHYAAERGFTDGIRLMVEYGGDKDATDNYGFSPYLWAVITMQRRAILEILALGVNVNSTTTDGKSALSWAASLGYLAIVQLLVESGAEVMPMNRYTKMMPLEEAAASGSSGTVELLLKLGADPNYRDHAGWSAIHWAAEEGYVGIVRALLVRGANANAISSYGTSPLHCAANGGHVDILSLLGNRSRRSQIHMPRLDPTTPCRLHGTFSRRQILLEDDRIRSSASQQDNHGWSALHLAVHSRNLATVRALLDSSVVSKSRLQADESGLAAEDWLDFVSLGNSYRTTSDLAFGKSRCCRTVIGLRQAVVDGNIPIIEFLLRRGYDINSTNSGRRTALYYAVKKGLILIMNMLLDMAADPNILLIGRMAWEEFVSNDMVLTWLRQAGYRRHSTDPETNNQIRLALKDLDPP